MKKAYCKPEMGWISLQPDTPIAAPCWANSGKRPIYHDIPGIGYCEATLSGGCGKSTVVAVKIIGADHMTSQEIADAEAWMMDHLAEKMATAGNNLAPFKGSGFTTSPDPSWS